MGSIREELLTWSWRGRALNNLNRIKQVGCFPTLPGLEGCQEFVSLQLLRVG